MNWPACIRLTDLIGPYDQCHFRTMVNYLPQLRKTFSSTLGMYKQVKIWLNPNRLVVTDSIIVPVTFQKKLISSFLLIKNIGEHIANVSCTSSTFTIAWHPKRYLLAYACDEKDKYDRDRSVGLLKVYGFPNEDSSSRSSGTTVEK